MKNLFTLGLALVLSSTALQAKEDIDLSSLYSAGTQTINFDGTWLWKSVNYKNGDTYADKSAFNYVIVKYSSATTSGNVIAQYNPDGTTGTYGENYYTSSASFSAFEDGGLVAVPLDADHKSTVNCIAIQNGNSKGDITITEAYFATTAEYETAAAEDAAKVKKLTLTGNNSSGTVELAAKTYGWASNWLDMDVSKYNTLVFELGAVSGASQITIQGKDATGNTLADIKKSIAISESSIHYIDISNMGTLSQYAFQNLNKPDESELEADIKATTINVTKVYLTSETLGKSEDPTSIGNVTASKQAADGAIYNIAGQKVNNDYKGVVIQNGKKFVQK